MAKDHLIIGTGFARYVEHLLVYGMWRKTNTNIND